MFSENLKTARKAKGITQEELAMHLNVVRQTISKWEKGLSVPDADLLIRLSEMLEVPVSKLLGEKLDIEQGDTDLVAEHLSRINEQLADRTVRTRRFVKIILIIICVIFCFIVFYTMLQFVGTDIRGELTVTASDPISVPFD